MRTVRRSGRRPDGRRTMTGLVLDLAVALGACALVAAALALGALGRSVDRLRGQLAEREREGEELRRREAVYRQLAAEQAALRRVADAVVGSSGQAEVLDLVAEEAARLLGAEMGQVCRFSGPRALVVGAWGDGALVRDGWFSLHGSQAMAEVVRGRATRVDDYGALAGSDRTGEEAIHPSQFGAVAAPIWVDSELWGAVLVVSSHPVAGFPPGAEARLGRFAELVALAVAASAERDRLRGLATTDALTGIANRRGFDQRLHAEIERCRRRGHSLSLVLVDIDNFKRINDTYGHQVGDEVLVEFARRLQDHARESDVVARMGGEEFAWILPETSAQAARDAADRARRLIASIPFPTAGRVTASAGVCDVAAAGLEAGELVRLADVALYRAKQAGRDATEVIGPEEAAAIAGAQTG
jgi:diguanylate cyclase (GGDEF)-like protein